MYGASFCFPRHMMLAHLLNLLSLLPSWRECFNSEEIATQRVCTQWVTHSTDFNQY